MRQGHSCLAEYAMRGNIISNLQCIHTSITTLTAEPEVVDNVINPLFQRFTPSNASSLLRKNENKNRGKFGSKKQSRVANLLRTNTTRDICFFWKTILIIHATCKWHWQNLHLLDEDTCSVSLPCAKYQESETVPTTVEISLPKQNQLLLANCQWSSLWLLFYR